MTGNEQPPNNQPRLVTIGQLERMQTKLECDALDSTLRPSWMTDDQTRGMAARIFHEVVAEGVQAHQIEISSED